MKVTQNETENELEISQNEAGYIYVIWPVEILRHNLPIYKVGRTSCISRRLSDYGKHSSLHLSLYVQKPKEVEQALLKVLRMNSKMKPRTDYGSEYFECKLIDLVTFVTKFLDTYAVNLEPESHEYLQCINMKNGNKKKLLNSDDRNKVCKGSFCTYDRNSVLIQTLLDANPGLRDCWRISGEASHTGNEGLFYCDPNNKFWRQVSDIFVEKFLYSAYRDLATLNNSPLKDEDKEYVRCFQSIQALRKLLPQHLLPHGICQELDNNLDVFALRNGLFDMNTSMFRPITHNDMISMHANWEYDSDLSQRHRYDVEAFLEQIFPIKSERSAFIKFISRLLSGRRKENQFVILTDQRAGNSGKSTLLNFLYMFFDNYACMSFWNHYMFTRKELFKKNKDSQNATLQHFKGKRLVIAEEITQKMTINVNLLERLTDCKGHNRKNTENNNIFALQAGIILVCVDKNPPSTDGPLQKRLLNIPMRSKFVHEEASRFQNEPYTYPMDINIHNRFKDWLPAFADILLECYFLSD